MSDAETPLSSSPTPPPPPPSAKSRVGTKSSKPSKKVILRLPTEALAKFPSAQPPRKASRSKPAISSIPDSDAKNIDSPGNEETSELNGVSSESIIKAEDAETAPTTNGAKRKGIPGPKPGAKRSAPGSGVDANGLPKPRGKPGPKKKLKGDGEAGTGASAAATKLGPKANQGAINAGLRALDRSGKPCRRWNKTGFQLKTFTGSTWTMPTWYSLKNPEPETIGEENSDQNGSSDAKPENVSSVVDSEKSNSGGDGVNLALPVNGVNGTAGSHLTNGATVGTAAA